MHSVGCPNFGKTFSWKTRFPEIGTSTQMGPGFGAKSRILARKSCILARNRSFFCLEIFCFFEFLFFGEHLSCGEMCSKKVPQIT